MISGRGVWGGGREGVFNILSESWKSWKCTFRSSKKPNFFKIQSHSRSCTIQPIFYKTKSKKQNTEKLKIPFFELLLATPLISRIRGEVRGHNFYQWVYKPLRSTFTRQFENLSQGSIHPFSPKCALRRFFNIQVAYPMHHSHTHISGIISRQYHN